MGRRSCSRIHDERPQAHTKWRRAGTEDSYGHSGEGKTSGLSIRSELPGTGGDYEGEQGTLQADGKTRFDPGGGGYAAASLSRAPNEGEDLCKCDREMDKGQGGTDGLWNEAGT